jgi:hypothetical protein
MKIPAVGAELFHVDGRTDMAKVIVAFRNFANASKKGKCKLKVNLLPLFIYVCLCAICSCLWISCPTSRNFVSIMPLENILQQYFLISCNWYSLSCWCPNLWYGYDTNASFLWILGNTQRCYCVIVLRGLCLARILCRKYFLDDD